MQWKDVTRTRSRSELRQFAWLWLTLFGGFTAWRLWHRHLDASTYVIGGLAVGLGSLGVLRPVTMRWIYTAWMAAAFPIAWVVSRVVLTALYLVVFTPIAIVFRVMGRDALQRRRRDRASYWIVRTSTGDVTEYLRQS